MNLLLLNGRETGAPATSLAEALRRSSAPTHITIGVRRQEAALKQSEFDTALTRLLAGEAGEPR